MIDRLDNVKVLEQNTIKINNIYFDPYRIKEETYDAEMIFITHSHYDHLSLEDLKKIKNDNTIVIAPEDCGDKLSEIFQDEQIFIVEPNNKYKLFDVKFETIPMYNIGKEFHPIENEWVGYIIYIDGVSYCIAGDTDMTEELINSECDVLVIPIGGTYTMNVEEAVFATKLIGPKVAIPTHYATIVGSLEDGLKFKSLLPIDVECKLYK